VKRVRRERERECESARVRECVGVACELKRSVKQNTDVGRKEKTAMESDCKRSLERNYGGYCKESETVEQ